MQYDAHLDLNMTVSDVLTTFPQAIPLFIAYRMACVGCSMNAFETLGDAARIYQVPPEVLLEQIRQAVETQNSSQDRK